MGNPNYIPLPVANQTHGLHIGIDPTCLRGGTWYVGEFAKNAGSYIQRAAIYVHPFKPEEVPVITVMTSTDRKVERLTDLYYLQFEDELDQMNVDLGQLLVKDITEGDHHA